MSFNMIILRSLEQVRVPFLDMVHLILSYLGSEIAAVVVAFAVYWCISKRSGIFLFVNCIFASGVNQIVKLFFHVPRPFVKYEDFHEVEIARSTMGGFSFPSGHTQSATSLYGSIFVMMKRKRIRVLCVVMIALVAYSRLYLGAHYPTDVLGGFCIGMAMLLLMSVLFRKIEESPYLVSVLFGIGAVVMIVVLWMFERGSWRSMVQDLVSEEVLADMLKGLGICAGLALGVAIGLPMERKYVRFETEAVWWAQILKTVIGLAIFAGLMLAMKYPAQAILGKNSFAYVLRYLIPALFGICVWPMTFRLFPGKEHD